MRGNARAAQACAVALLIFASVHASFGQQPPVSSAAAGGAESVLQQATRRVAGETRYELRYRMKPGESFRWSVEHTANSHVSQKKQSTDTSMRSTAVKNWRIERADSLGNITLTHSVESMRLWQRVGEQPPTSYDSENDTVVPAIFENVASMRGKPLATITVSPQGAELHRDTEHLILQLGYGNATVPLPDHAIAIGEKWNTPQQWRVRSDDGNAKLVHGRTCYELKKVIQGKAYIAFHTEALTPIDSDAIRAQLMHHLSRGYVVFDMALGLISMREIEWECKVQGHVSPDSFMHHTAKLTETLLLEVRPAIATQRSAAQGEVPVVDR